MYVFPASNAAALAGREKSPSAAFLLDYGVIPTGNRTRCKMSQIHDFCADLPNFVQGQSPLVHADSISTTLRRISRFQSGWWTGQPWTVQPPSRRTVGRL